MDVDAEAPDALRAPISDLAFGVFFEAAGEAVTDAALALSFGAVFGVGTRAILGTVAEEALGLALILDLGVCTGASLDFIAEAPEAWRVPISDLGFAMIRCFLAGLLRCSGSVPRLRFLPVVAAASSYESEDSSPELEASLLESGTSSLKLEKSSLELEDPSLELGESPLDKQFSDGKLELKLVEAP